MDSAFLGRSVAEDEDAYDFRAPTRSRSLQIESDLVIALSRTRAFKRLEEIRFLGALDYYLITGPNGLPYNSRFSRAQHSLGVAALAQCYLQLADQSGRNQRLCIASAMLHDIGHTPFSHTLEPVFKERFGLNHHSVTEAMIRGEDEEFRDIAEVLSAFSIDTDEIIAVLSAAYDPFDQFFSGPINFDTVEGILRSRQYIKMSSMGLAPRRVIESSFKRESAQDERIVDSFWSAKHDIYNLVIRSAYGAMLDLVFKAIVEKYPVEPNDFYLTDNEAFRKFPLLRTALDLRQFDGLRSDLIGDHIEVVERTFFIDPSVDFGSRNDQLRYRQSKRVRMLTLPNLKAISYPWEPGVLYGNDPEAEGLL